MNAINGVRQLSVRATCLTSIVLTAFGQDAKSTEAASGTVTPQSHQLPGPRAIELKASDGTILKASYFAAAKPGPGVLLFHQSNRTRKSWDDVAEQLATAGINTLTVDTRGHGESGGKYDNWTDPNKEHAKQYLASDIDATFQYLVSQPGVKRDVIGVGGAGLLGVDNSIQTARQHSAEVKSLALLSGETFRPGLQFLRQVLQLAGCLSWTTTTNIRPQWRRCICSRAWRRIRARSSCTTLQLMRRRGCGTSR